MYKVSFNSDQYIFVCKCCSAFELYRFVFSSVFFCRLPLYASTWPIRWPRLRPAHNPLLELYQPRGSSNSCGFVRCNVLRDTRGSLTRACEVSGNNEEIDDPILRRDLCEARTHPLLSQEEISVGIDRPPNPLYLLGRKVRAWTVLRSASWSPASTPPCASLWTLSSRPLSSAPPMD